MNTPLAAHTPGALASSFSWKNPGVGSPFFWDIPQACMPFGVFTVLDLPPQWNLALSSGSPSAPVMLQRRHLFHFLTKLRCFWKCIKWWGWGQEICSTAALSKPQPQGRCSQEKKKDTKKPLWHAYIQPQSDHSHHADISSFCSSPLRSP